jgi:hypothetical protein
VQPSVETHPARGLDGWPFFQIAAYVTIRG